MSGYGFRECGIEGVDKLVWVKGDIGAYDLILDDWKRNIHDWLRMVKNFDVVVQAGGNCGMYPRFYKNYFKEVYTFEPEPNNFHCLDQNCQGEGYHKFYGGLGDENKKVSVVYDGHPTVFNAGQFAINEEKGNIQLYRLDDLNLQKCDLIHLDVEGYEAKVLEGARETIKRCQPVIITEVANGTDILSKELQYKPYIHAGWDIVFITNQWHDRPLTEEEWDIVYAD
jgi:FkbM family methyltransferase